MALLKYFKKMHAITADVPDHSGMLSIIPPKTIIAANRPVRTIQQAQRAG